MLISKSRISTTHFPPRCKLPGAQTRQSHAEESLLGPSSGIAFFRWPKLVIKARTAANFHASTGVGFQ
jgi:hypothetical protein